MQLCCSEKCIWHCVKCWKKSYTVICQGKKKISTTPGKKFLPKRDHPYTTPPPPPEKVNLYTESVFLLASVMVNINSVKSWWSKGLHLPSVGLLVQTRKKFKETEKKKFTIHDSVVCDKPLRVQSVFSKTKKIKILIFSQINLFFQQKARLSLQMMVTSARKK